MARALGLLSSYTATLTTAIEGVLGETLEMSQTWGFRTRDGEWGDRVLIEISNAVAVWFQSDGTRNNIWANRFE